MIYRIAFFGKHINDALGYIVSYKFVHIVGINEVPQKGFSGTCGNNREWHPQVPKVSQPWFVTLRW